MEEVAQRNPAGIFYLTEPPPERATGLLISISNIIKPRTRGFYVHQHKNLMKMKYSVASQCGLWCERAEEKPAKVGFQTFFYEKGAS